MSKSGKHIRFKGRIKQTLQMSLYLGALLAIVDVLIYLFNVPAGIILSVYLVLYFAVVLVMFNYTRAALLSELVSFATHYGQVQKVLLKELEIPYALLDDEGHILWMNEYFKEISHKEDGYNKSILSAFPGLPKDQFLKDEDYAQMELWHENCNYQVKMRKLTMKESIKSNSLVETSGYDGYLIACYMFDNTAVKLALQEIDDQSLCVGMIYLDNYEEALESVEEVRRSLLIALIDRKINKYVSALDGICKKLEKDKYMIVLRKKSIAVLKENKFDILEEVKTVNIGNDMPVTISIGVGLDGLSYNQNYEFARNAIDLALGRGGDQAIVKTPDNVAYFGGKSQQVEKNTRVKARVKAQALQEIISNKEQVLVMGHRNADLDSFGAAVGIYRIARTLEKKAHIVLTDVPGSIKPLVDIFANGEYEEDMIITGNEAIEIADNNTALVVVDVNKPSLTECSDLLRVCKSIVVLDHHRKGSESIENATLSYVEAYASSACEMVSEIMQYIGGGVHISCDEADCMYAGMIVDTTNFMTKTGVRTFEAAAFLRRNGADVTRVRKLFRADVNEYRAKADIIARAQIYRDVFAISDNTLTELATPTVVGAQAANELLDIKGIKASFIFTDLHNEIYISARSIDEVNGQVIMEKMGGGGHLSQAGTQLENVSLEEAKNELKRILDEMIEGGELKI